MAAAPLCGQAVHPRDLNFPPLSFEPPDPLSLRHLLNSGLRAYLAENPTLPLVNLVAMIDYGSLYDPQEKAGLADLMQDSLVKGGSAGYPGARLEERIDFLGGSISFYVGQRTATLSLSVLSKDMQEGLSIFFDLLQNPQFSEESLEVARNRMIEGLKQANDSPRPVLEREYARLLYGEHPLTRITTKSTVEAVERADLLEIHKKYFFPGNVILAASGDFRLADLKRRINRLTRQWQNRKTEKLQIPAEFAKITPGVYFIQRPINQGYVNMGHLGISDDHPDFFAVQVMNFILGGGSFTSRITSKVRSDEGLAYNTGSRFTFSPGLPGLFAGYVQTKSETVSYAIELIRREFERIRNEPVLDSEMETALNYYQESFANIFATPDSTVRSFAMLEMQGKPFDYYKNYRRSIAEVDKEKVLEVAAKHIRPEELVILVVGDWEPCNRGSEKFPHGLDHFGPVQKIALIDRLSGEEIK